MRARKLAQYSKFVAAALGLIALAVAQGWLHGTAETAAEWVLGVATALGVYAVPNVRPSTPTEPPRGS